MILFAYPIVCNCSLPSRTEIRNADSTALRALPGRVLLMIPVVAGVLPGLCVAQEMVDE
jgi:hypothetical protein